MIDLSIKLKRCQVIFFGCTDGCSPRKPVAYRKNLAPELPNQIVIEFADGRTILARRQDLFLTEV